MAPRDREPPSCLTLVGLSGAGKSTVARLLAARWEHTSLDLDAEIEARAGMTIPEIFENHGESGFRRLEGEALEAVLARDGVVVATGGGAPCSPGAMARILAAGPAVWLRGRPETLVARVLAQDARPGGGRPLLAGGQSAALERLHALLEARGPTYQRADVTVDVDDRTAEEVAAAIDAWWRA